MSLGIRNGRLRTAYMWIIRLQDALLDGADRPWPVSPTPRSTYIGLDVDKNTISVGILELGAEHFSTVKNDRHGRPITDDPGYPPIPTAPGVLESELP